MSEVVISLTTIPSRARHLAEFLDCINHQTILPSRIELNLPAEYHKRSLGKVDRSLIPSDFDVYECEDFGPATKVLPTLKRYADSDVRIIYCDDDRVYDKNWVHNLVTASGRTPDRAICDECVSINSILYRYHYPRKDMRYKVKKALSLGKFRPYHTDKWKDADIAQGFGGVLVRPSFFTDMVFSIPAVLWSVDDIWLLGNMASNGTGIRWSGRKREEKSVPIFVDGQDLGRLPESLNLSECDGFGRLSADYYAVRYFQENFGTWSEKNRVAKRPAFNTFHMLAREGGAETRAG
jgi:hypothetical protein